MKFLSLAVLLPTLSFARPPVIYGDDNRIDIAKASETHQLLARSTPVMIPNKAISLQSDGTYSTTQTTFEDWIQSQVDDMAKAAAEEENQSSEPAEGEQNPFALFKDLKVCEDEAFGDQPNPGVCSGFLIAPDLVVTAGHCASMERACESNKWVFDFVANNNEAGEEIPAENVYACKRIVSVSLNPLVSTDYAIFQLDRKVKGRTPLKIRQDGYIKNGQSLFMIGNPSGLPLKLATNASVRINTNSMYFQANTDSFSGNSGSAVFNAETNVVEGILVRGEEDFDIDADKKCFGSKRCKNEECRGEDVSRINAIPEVALLSMLTKAAETSNLAMLKRIIDLKIYVDIYLEDGQSVLMKAVIKGLKDSAELLIKSGADINLQDANGDTALHFAARSANEALYKFLVDAGARTDIKNDAGLTPIAQLYVDGSASN